MSYFEILKYIFKDLTLERLCVGGMLAAGGGAVLGLAIQAQNSIVASILAFLCVYAIGIGFYVLYSGGSSSELVEGISR